jgi:hypothetical protein
MGPMKATGATCRKRLRALLAVDLRSLALLRITLAVLLLVDLASRARLLAANYTDLGAFPRDAIAPLVEPSLLPGLHGMAGSARFQLALFAAAAVAAAALGAGWRTRLATFASWVLLGSLHQRNPLLLDGGDHLLRHLLFWSLFLPLGARFSLDARRRRTEAAVDVCSPASAALLLQAASVFLVTGWAKTGPEWTTDHTAIAYALDRRWWILPFGEWLLAHPPLPSLLTPAVRWFEMLGPLLLFVPFANAWFRAAGILGLWGLLGGLALGLRLNLFPFITGAGLLAFLPTACWRALANLFPRLGAAPAPPPAPRPPARRTARALGHVLVVALLLLLIGWGNLATLEPELGPPASLSRVGRSLQLEQGWTMYAPSPRRVDVWFEHRGRLANGVAIDLDVTPGGPGWRDVERAWRDYRFLYALQKLVAPPFEPQAAAYARWLCSRWNHGRTGGARLEHVAVTAVIEPIALPGEEQPPATRQPLATALCPGA